MPASFGVHGPGESTMASGSSRERLVDADLVVAPHRHVGAELAEIMDEIEGEAVVIVDQRDALHSLSDRVERVFSDAALRGQAEQGALEWVRLSGKRRGAIPYCTLRRSDSPEIFAAGDCESTCDSVADAGHAVRTMMTALAAPHQRKCDRDRRFVRVRLLAAGLSGRQGCAAPMRSAVLTALIVATALFMENMDGTVISTSLPAIARDLHQDPIVLKLALTSYMLTLAVFIPASGWVADRFGARTVFCSAIVVFTLGSILCGASTSLETLIAARVFQGLGGAMMVPVGRLVLLRTVQKAISSTRSPISPCRRCRAGRRAAARRLHHHLFPLALDLLDQRADRRPRRRCCRSGSSPTCARRSCRASTSRASSSRASASSASSRACR